MNSNIEDLFKSTIFGKTFEADILQFLKRITESSMSSLEFARVIYRLDKEIGGYGVHNINKFSDGTSTITGTYFEGNDERGIYRGLQYCAGELLWYYGDLNLNLRNIVRNSSSHIEGILSNLAKRISPVQLEGKSMSYRIKVIKNSEWLKQTNITGEINTAQIITMIDNQSKHDYFGISDAYPVPDRRELEIHRFSCEESLITYFGSRINGMSVMKVMYDYFEFPRSMKSVPSVGIDDFLKTYPIPQDDAFRCSNRKRTDQFVKRRLDELAIEDPKKLGKVW